MPFQNLQAEINCLTLCPVIPVQLPCQNIVSVVPLPIGLSFDDDAHLTAIFMTTWVSRYQNVSILDLIEAKGDGGGCDNWSYKTCKAPVKSSPPTNKHPTFYALPVAQPTVSEHWREKVSHFMDRLSSSSPWGLASLSWPLKAPGYYGESGWASHQGWASSWMKLSNVTFHYQMIYFGKH